MVSVGCLVSGVQLGMDLGWGPRRCSREERLGLHTWGPSERVHLSS